jgi:ArsR family transcriptional regulator
MTPGAKKNPQLYARTAAVFRALAHASRVRLLERLVEGECCVSEIENTLGISQPNVSQHLKVLRDAGLVVGSRRGTKICYKIADERLRRVIAAFLEGD